MAHPYSIVDAHVHVIERLAGFGGRGELRAIGGGKGRWATGEISTFIPKGWGEFSFSHGDLVQILATHGVSKAVMLQGSYYGFCNDYTHEAQLSHPGVLYGLGTFDPYCSQAKSIMARLIEDFSFKGFKFEMSAGFGLMGYHPDFRLDGERMEELWSYAEMRQLAVSLDLGTFGEPSLQLAALAEVAGRHRGIRFVVEHLFFPGPGHLDQLRRGLESLSAHTNISVTVASVPASLRPEPYPFPSARAYLEVARDILGAGRMLWGSDLPSTATDATYAQLIDYVANLGLFREDELRGIYGENAIRVYHL